MKKIILATVLVTASATVLAWGPREQAALTGLAIGISASALANQTEQSEPRYNHHRHEPVYVQPQLVYIQTQPQICGYNVYCGSTQCWAEPIYDQWGRIIADRQVCR